MTDTIEYWKTKAREALREAEKISEATGQEFYFSVGDHGATYVPENRGPMSKQRALKLLASGRNLEEAEKKAIRDAIENETIINDVSDDWYGSNTGWVSSSDLC